MIPTFPQFKEVDLTDKQYIEMHTNRHQPYSDFNFTNLWAWNTVGGRMVSELNGNLVILFTDYRTCEPMLSFLGTNEIEDTTRLLISHSQKLCLPPILSFITEESAAVLKESNFIVTEDKENFDYIFSTSELANPLGSKLKQKRRYVKKFVNEHPNAIFEIGDINNRDIQKQIVSTIRRWENKKKLDSKAYELEHEEIAIKRLLATSDKHNLIVSGVFLDSEMIGFSIDEILPNNFAISHFIKADTTFKGVYEFMNEKISQHLLDLGVEFWNWEQDLNIEGLRRLKTSYRPVSFLKKYRVSLETSNNPVLN